ncbi:hypothetical protein BN136_3596 [Cronobacter universalis NCTC 9529]|nr:hypothetical protein BN136_3596 [Cronobacter universalis NCTC 9529]
MPTTNAADGEWFHRGVERRKWRMRRKKGGHVSVSAFLLMMG